ncbi:hypothetical protein JAAARDRAFT_447960 [Jaapia argillacea MUCL 33604]|uniref:F-box domain-containing protein n=1 Tax=Jaapia argillacea MUCL 33604 TaxID=933084 RepID=A0A067Q4Z9_9AGAM|nr:hypothetical protein JAAARDRAFT_447960 [Jaapia argillacea MUCL 33604]
MHYAMEIPEILTNIFENLRSVTLPAVARTCLAFREPALDLLWHSDASLGDLIRCMPPDAWKEEVVRTPGWVDGEVSVLTFARPLFPSDWPRFLHASRMRCLEVRYCTYRSGRYSEIAAQVLLDLAIYRPCSTLFPALKDLLWSNWTLTPIARLDSLPYIHIFLAPHLRKIRIFLDDPGELEAKYFIASLSHHTPKLLYVNISSISIPPLSLGATTLARLNQLQTLVISLIAPGDVVFLSSLPHLRRLELTISLPMPLEARFRRDLEVSESSRSSGHSPSTLRHLAVTGVGLDTFVAVFQIWGRCALEGIAANFPRPAEAEVFRDFFRTLSIHCSTSSLTSIKLVYKGRDAVNSERMAENFTITPELFRPLLAFTKMRRCEVSAPLSFAFDDAFVRQLAIAWPEMTHLDLAGDRGHPAISKVTLEGLAEFPHNCPNLAFLCIVLHQAAKVMSTPILCNDTPITLHLGHTPIQDPADVARFLSGLYTNIKEFAHLYRFDEADFAIDEDVDSLYDLCEGWGKVDELYDEFAKIRIEDRRRWQSSSTKPAR